MLINKLVMVGTLVLSACSTTTETIRVAKVPEPPVIQNPVLEIHSLTSSSTSAEIVKAYYVSILRLQAAFEEAKAALDAYRSK